MGIIWQGNAENYVLVDWVALKYNWEEQNDDCRWRDDGAFRWADSIILEMEIKDDYWEVSSHY